jgi:hypothetical protein
MGVSKISTMKRSLVLAFALLNFISTCAAFMFYLNWYDTGDLDFSGWRGMIIAGTVCGLWVVRLCARPFHTFDNEVENIYLFLIRQVAFNGLGLIASFALGYALELLVFVKDPAGMFSIVPTILMIPLIAMFYSLMMMPFAVYLGITNGLLFRFTGQKQLQRAGLSQ